MDVKQKGWKTKNTVSLGNRKRLVTNIVNLIFLFNYFILFIYFILLLFFCLGRLALRFTLNPGSNLKSKIYFCQKYENILIVGRF